MWFCPEVNNPAGGYIKTQVCQRTGEKLHAVNNALIKIAGRNVNE